MGLRRGHLVRMKRMLLIPNGSSHLPYHKTLSAIPPCLAIWAFRCLIVNRWGATPPLYHANLRCDNCAFPAVQRGYFSDLCETTRSMENRCETAIRSRKQSATQYGVGISNWAAELRSLGLFRQSPETWYLMLCMLVKVIMIWIQDWSTMKCTIERMT